MTRSKNNQKTKAKFENNWFYKSLESLEKNYWKDPDPDDNSYLVNTCHRLRKKQLKDFETEDLRIMISQNIGLKYLIPLALDKLTENILAEGDYYEGDLLHSVLRSDKEYWKAEVDNWNRMCEIFKQNKEALENDDTTKKIRKGWFDAFAEFEKIK